MSVRHATMLETLQVTVPEGALEAYEAALEQVCGTVGFFLDEATGAWTVEGVKQAGEGEPNLQAALAVAQAASGFAATLSRLPTEAEGWLARTHSAFPEQRIGRRFVVRGSHLPPAETAGRITLVLDAAMAFGSGEHGSTRGCLLALEAMAHRRPRRVLDMGTGTGILAMAAARLLNQTVLAADIDPWSVRTAQDNVRQNRLTGRVRVRQANGWRSAWVSRAGPYELVFANILARPLCRMAPALAGNLAPGGTAILSGLLDRQARWVLAAHRHQGLVLEREQHESGWATLVLRKPCR